jgi:hypothetical protein
VKGREQAGPGGDYIPIGVHIFVKHLSRWKRKEKKEKEKTATRRVRVRSSGNTTLLVSHFRRASFTVGCTLKKSK